MHGSSRPVRLETGHCRNLSNPDVDAEAAGGGGGEEKRRRVAIARFRACGPFIWLKTLRRRRRARTGPRQGEKKKRIRPASARVLSRSHPALQGGGEGGEERAISTPRLSAQKVEGLDTARTQKREKEKKKEPLAPSPVAGDLPALLTFNFFQHSCDGNHDEREGKEKGKACSTYTLRAWVLRMTISRRKKEGEGREKVHALIGDLYSCHPRKRCAPHRVSRQFARKEGGGRKKKSPGP